MVLVRQLLLVIRYRHYRRVWRYQAIAKLPLHDWFHVKLVVKANTVSVYVDHNDKPAMVFSPLDTSLPEGSVGFWLGNCQEAAFRNLSVKE